MVWWESPVGSEAFFVVKMLQHGVGVAFEGDMESQKTFLKPLMYRQHDEVACRRQVSQGKNYGGMCTNSARVHGPILLASGGRRTGRSWQLTKAAATGHAVTKLVNLTVRHARKFGCVL
jgi:hypothetical protein